MCFENELKKPTTLLSRSLSLSLSTCPSRAFCLFWSLRKVKGRKTKDSLRGLDSLDNRSYNNVELVLICTRLPS